MKKILVIFFLIFQFFLPVFAEYKPIPKNLSKQYKAEMEQIIAEEYPQVIKKIDNEVKYATSLRNKIFYNGYNLEASINLVLTQEVVIPAADMQLYDKLMKITQEKYLGIRHVPIGTDCTIPMETFLKPYFIDNNVDQTKLIKIMDYMYKKNKVIEKYRNQIDKMYPKNFDNYEPIPEILEDEYVKKIPENLIKNFRLDMSKGLKHILFDKITYNHKTLKQMLFDFNKKSDLIFHEYLNNPQNYEQNKIFIKQLQEMSGTISLYPDTIIEQMQPYIEKYNLGLVPGSENDTFLYKYYIEKYQVNYSDKLKELLKLKEYVYTKINIYILKISDKI